MSQTNIHRLILVGLGLGLAAVGAYLNTHGDHDAWFLWVGVVICFVQVL